MKKRSFSKKLSLNKQTVADLSKGQMKVVKGGTPSAPCDSEDIFVCLSILPDTECGFCLTYWTCNTCYACG